MTTVQGQFCWNELQTTDTNKAKEFYGNLLGWTFHDHNTPNMQYTMIKVDGKDIGGIMACPSNDKKVPPHWMSYINVIDLNSTVKKAQELGGILQVPPTEVPDMGSFALIQDPTGAYIAFWQTK